MRSAANTVRYTVSSCAVWVVLTGGIAAKQACAADGDEIPPPAPKYLSLDHLDAYLELKAEFASVQVDTQGQRLLRPGRSQKNRDWTVEERLGLKLGGTVLDPGVITYGGEISFALTQSRFEERTWLFDRNDDDNGTLLTYDLRADFFRGKKVSGSIYGLRQDDRINRRFQPTLDQRRTGFGTNWVFSDDRFPMELSYDYLETDRTGNADRRDDEHFTASNLHYGADWIIAEHHRFKFSYEHAETKQEYQGSRRSFETTRDLFGVEHQLEFGPTYEHTLRTLVQWQGESGDFARDYFRIGPQLTLKHSDTLQTSYKYQADREVYEGIDVEIHRADFLITHQLYSNLTTTADVFGLKENVDGSVDTDQYGASVDWQYNRKNPYGHLYSNLALAYDTQNTSSDLGRRVVLDEAQTFRDPIAITLRNRNVIPWTIVVTDASNRRYYRIGIDYAVIHQKNVTRLIRLPTGQIADRDTILVDYLYRTPADGQLDTIRVDFNLEQRFSNGWTPYYRFSYRNQEDDGSAVFFRRTDRTDHHRLGVNYEAKRYTVGAEFEIFDDTVEPYDAYHLNGLLRVVQSPDHTLNASTRFSQLFFDGGGLDNRDVILIDVELDHRWQLSERWSTIQRLAYRYEDDSRDGVTHGWDVTAGFEYVVGDLSGELTFDYDRLALPDSEENDYGVFVRVRREVPNVLASR
ncbi:MAG: hypothetical protein V1790_07905 [Planctomycetota bacterium]